MMNSLCNCKCGGCTTAKIAKILLVIGGLNWGLMGVGMLFDANWNIVYMLLGHWSALEAIVYILVGVAAVVKLFGCRCKKCMGNCGGSCTCASDGKGEAKM